MATFTGTGGSDAADAGSGTLTGFTGGTIAELQDAIGDSFSGLDGSDTVIAGTGNDSIRGGLAADTLFGGEGNDIIQYVGAEIVAGDYMDGGSGTDSLTLLSGSATVDLTVATITGIESLISLSGADSINMTATQFVGFNTVNAGGGTDTVRVNIDGAYDFTAAATPVLTGVERLWFNGGANDDTLIISSALFDAAHGIDLGGGVNDTLVVKNEGAVFDWGAIFPSGGGVNNVEFFTIIDGEGSDNLSFSTSPRNFNVSGNGGNDTITTYTGADTLVGGIGDDSLNGNGGVNDVAVYAGPLANYTVVSNANGTYTITDMFGTDGTDTVRNIEFVNFGGTVYAINNLGGGGTGGPPAVFTGTSGADTADANAGTLTGFTGGTIAQLQDSVGDTYHSLEDNDYINSGTGGDTVYGSAGADTILTNEGADLVILGTGDFEAGEVINGSTGLDTILATGIVDFTLGTLDHFGRISMTDGGVNMSIRTSQIYGSGATTISGGAGDDTLNVFFTSIGSGSKDLSTLAIPGIEHINIIDSFGGNNTITATAISDSINAGNGNDSVNGLTGDDTITGGNGIDTLDGGAGSADTATYIGLRENYTVTLSGPGQYTIVDNSGTEATDILTNIEFVTFSNGTFDIATLSGGGNQPPVGVNDDNTGDPVVEAGGVANGTPGDTTATGNVLANDTDPNVGDTLTVSGIRTGPEDTGGTFTDVSGATTVVGTYGTLVVNPDGTYTYTLDNSDADIQALNGGTSATEVFTYRLQDSGALNDIAEIRITIAGSNDTAVISGVSSGDATEDAGGLTTGALSVTDVDNGESEFQTTPVSGPAFGTFVIDTAGNWTYDLNDGLSQVQSLGATATLSETVTVRTVDGTTKDISITIHGTNDAPTVASPIADRVASQGVPLSFTLPADTFADVDNGDTMNLTATLPNGLPLPGWLTFDPSTRQFSGTPGAGDAGILNVRVTATDGSLASVFDDFQITVSNTNAAPVITSAANANFVENETGVALDVNATDTDGPGDVAYSITGTDASKFSIDAGTGQITFVTPPNFEAPSDVGTNNVYNIVVHAFDGLADTTQNVAITVTNQQNIIDDPNGNASTIFGTELEDKISARDRDDLIYGLGGDDSIDAGNGNDTMLGGAGSDTLSGSDGTDYASYAGESAVTINLETSIHGGAATGDVFKSVERYIGSSNGDTFVGNSLANFFYGADGADSFNGAGNGDTLLGESGNDSITGGAGSDKMSGGAGSDNFNFDATSESGTSNSSQDKVSDFVSHAQSATDADLIDLFDIDAALSAGGNNDFSFIGTAAFTAEGQIRVVQSGANTIVQINNGGSLSADMTILLENFTAANLSALDFIL